MLKGGLIIVRTYHIMETLENGQERLVLAVLIKSKAVSVAKTLKRQHPNRSYKITVLPK